VALKHDGLFLGERSYDICLSDLLQVSGALAHVQRHNPIVCGSALQRNGTAGLRLRAGVTGRTGYKYGPGRYDHARRVVPLAFGTPPVLRRKRRIATEGHIVVIPKEHVPSVHALPMSAQKWVWGLVSEVRGRLRTGLVPDSGFSTGLV
jgi:hypothetical protein